MIKLYIIIVYKRNILEIKEMDSKMINVKLILLLNLSIGMIFIIFAFLFTLKKHNNYNI